MSLSIGKTAPAPFLAPRYLSGQKFLDAASSSIEQPNTPFASGKLRLSRNFYPQEPQKDKKADEIKSTEYLNIKIEATEAERADREYYKTILAIAKNDIDIARTENPDLNITGKDFDKYVKAARIKYEFSRRFGPNPKLGALWKVVAEGDLEKAKSLLPNYSSDELNAQDVTDDYSLLVALTINALPPTIDPHSLGAKDKPKTTEPAIDNTPQMIDLLVKAGLRLGEHDAAGNNFLQMAAKEDKTELVKYLLDKDDEVKIAEDTDGFVNHVNSYGDTALKLAMQNDCCDVVAALVQHKYKREPIEIDRGMPFGVIINALTAYKTKRAYLVITTKLLETGNRRGAEEGNLIKAWIEENKLKDKLSITCEGMFPKDSIGLMAAWYYSDLNPYKPKDSNDKSKNSSTDMFRDQTREGAEAYREFLEKYKYSDFGKNYKAKQYSTEDKIKNPWLQDDQILVAEDPGWPNRLPLLKALMSSQTRFNANATDNLGRNGVHYAVLLGKFGPGLPVSGAELLAVLNPALAENRPNVDGRDNEGWTPLMYAITRQGQQGIEDAFQILLAHGADLEARTGSGNMGKAVLDIFIEKRLKYIEEQNRDEKPEFRLIGKASIFDGGGFTLLDALHKKYANINEISSNHPLVDLAVEYGDSELFKRLDEIRKDNGGTVDVQPNDNPQITMQQIRDMKKVEKAKIQRARKRLTGPPVLATVTVRIDPCSP